MKRYGSFSHNTSSNKRFAQSTGGIDGEVKGVDLPPKEEEEDSDIFDPYGDSTGTTHDFNASKPLPTGNDTSNSKLFNIADFTGKDRERLDEIMYLVDGVKPSQPITIRLNSALKLAQQIKDKETCFLLRANHGFEQVFDALVDTSDNETLSYALATISFLASKESSNLNFFTEDLAKALLVLISPSVATQLIKSPPSTPVDPVKQRRRRKSTTPQISKTDFLNLVDEDDRLFLTRGVDITRPAYLAYLALANASAAEDFASALCEEATLKVFLSMVVEDIGVLFQANATKTESPQKRSQLLTAVAARYSQRRLQGILNIFENMAHLVPRASSFILEANVEYTLKDQTEMKHTAPVVNVYTTTALMWIAHLCETLLSIEGSKDRKVLEFFCKHVTSLFRLLVNLTNFNSTGCSQMNQYTSPNVKIPFSINTLPGQRNALQTVLDIMSLSYRHEVAALFDILPLGLGIIINCIEESKESRNLINVCRVLIPESNDRNYLYEELSENVQLNFTPGTCFEFVAYLFRITYERYEEWKQLQLSMQEDSINSTTIERDTENEDQAKIMSTRAIVSYAAVFLGYSLLHISREVRPSMRVETVTPFVDMLPKKHVSCLIEVLKEFLILQSDANMLTEDALEGTVNILEFLQRMGEQIPAST